MFHTIESDFYAMKILDVTWTTPSGLSEQITFHGFSWEEIISEMITWGITSRDQVTELFTTEELNESDFLTKLGSYCYSLYGDV